MKKTLTSHPVVEATPEAGTWRWVFRSLRFKTSLLVVLLVVIITCIGTVLSSRAMSMVFYESEYSRTIEWAESLAAGTVGVVESGDRESLLHTANDLIKTQGVAYVAFADPTGKVLARGESRAGLLTPSLTPDRQHLRLEGLADPKLTWWSDKKIACSDVLVPVYSNQVIGLSGNRSRAIAGYLRFAADVTETKRQLERVNEQIGRIGMGLVLLAVPIALYVTRHVVSPLNELARTARAIASGVTEARAHVSSDDEIGDVARSFNTMADRLTESRMELLELNAVLEDRVQKRTRELRELASRDSLTDLYNRRHFTEVMAREFAAAERYDADLTCLMFDLDHFKKINDLYGHAAGDEILVLFAQAIMAELRESDVPARFGGDEFILLLPQTSATVASALVGRITERFYADVRERLPDVPAGVSIGAASLRTTRASSAEALVHEADTALYAAKQAGRDRTIEAADVVKTG